MKALFQPGLGTHAPVPPERRSLIGHAAVLVMLSVPALALAELPDPAPTLSPPSTWLQWRGPTRDGMVRDDGWPATLQGAALTLLWRVELGDGYASPIVTSNRVFTVETCDKSEEVVRAWDRLTGKEVWTTAWGAGLSVPFFAASNGSWVRSTPACDDRFLYVGGMRDLLLCLNTADGKEKWRVDFVQRYGTPLPSFGFVCSPLVVEDSLYVQAGGSFVKLDKESGKTLWRTLEDGGGMNGSAFSSPMQGSLCQRPQILVQSRTLLAGVEPRTGQVLWKQPVEAFRGMNILNPTLCGDRVFTSSYGGGSVLLGLDRREEAFSVRTIWKTKAEGYMSTPVVIDGHAYLHRRDRKFACVELASGQERWVTEKRFGQYWSLVSNGKLILALDQKGEMLLIRANPEKFDLLDRRTVSTAPAWAHLVVCGQEIFVREQKAIAAYRWRATASPSDK